MKKKLSKGFSVIEVVIGAAILLVTVSGASLAFQSIVRSAILSGHVVQAAFLLEEGVEVVKVIRGAGWDSIANLSVNTPYTLVYNSGVWSTQSNRVFISGLFDRTVTISNVYRDSNDNIASSGTLDSDTKKITVDVSWRERNATTTKTISTYVTNF